MPDNFDTILDDIFKEEEEEKVPPVDEFETVLAELIPEPAPTPPPAISEPPGPEPPSPEPPALDEMLQAAQITPAPPEPTIPIPKGEEPKEDFMRRVIGETDLREAQRRAEEDIGKRDLLQQIKFRSGIEQKPGATRVFGPEVVIPEPRTEKEINAFSNFATALERGDTAVAVDMLGAKAAFSGEDIWERDVKPVLDKQRELQLADPVKGANAFTNAFLGAVQMVPPLVKGGVAGAAGAAVGGKISPIGAAAGASFGSLQYWSRQGAGTVYNALREEGVNHDISSWVSIVAGPLYAVVEQSQATKLLPSPIRAALKTNIGRSFTKSAIKTMTRLGVTFLQEVGEEGLQRIITDTATEAGKWIDPDIKGTPIGEAAKDILKGAVEEMGEAAKTMPFLMVPGASVDAVNLIRRQKGEATLETEREAAQPGLRLEPEERVIAQAKKEVTPEIPTKKEAVEDAERIRAEAEIPGKEERFRARADEEIRVRDAEKDRLEAITPEAEERLKEVPRVEPTEKIVEVTEEEKVKTEAELRADIKKEQEAEVLRVEDEKPTVKEPLTVKEKIAARREEAIKTIKAEELAELETEITNIRGKIGIATKEISKIKVKEDLEKVPKVLLDRALLQQQLQKAKVKEIETVRQSVLDYAKSIGLEVEKGSRIGGLILKTKTKAGLNRALDEIDKRLVIIEERKARGKAVGNLKKTLKTTKKQKFRPEFQKKMDDLLDDIELAKAGKKTTKRLLGMKEFIESNPDHMIPQKQIDQLKRLDNIAVSDMDTEQVELLDASLKHINHLNTLKNSLIMKGKYRNFAKEKERAMLALDKYKGKLEYKVDEFSPFEAEKEAGAIKKIFTTGSWNAELISEIMDKEERGVIKNHIYDGIDEGYTTMYGYQQEMEDYFKEQIKGFGISEKELKDYSTAFRKKKKAKKTPTQKFKLESGKVINLTKAQKMSLYLQSLNPQNKRHIVEGGIAFPAKPSAIIDITEEDLKNITDSLSFKEFQLSGAIHNYFNNLQQKAINEIAVRLNGWEIAKEEDYFPIRTNALDRRRDQLKQVKNTADIRNFMEISLEGMGIFRERAKGAKGAIVLDDAFEAVYKSNKQVSAFVGLAEPLRNAKMLLYDNDFQIKVNNTYGKNYIDSLKSYIKDIEGASFQTEFTDDLISKANANITVAILGLNPWVMLKQFPSYALAGTEMDLKYMGNLTPASKALMSQWSPQLRKRFQGNINRDLGELNEASNVQRFFGFKPNLINSMFMGGISKFDYEAIGRIWKAVEKETKDLKPDLKVGSDAYYTHVARRSEEVIRKTQPTFELKDRSEIARSKQWFVRLVTKFSSARNKIYMVFRRSIEKYNRSNKTINDKAKLMKTVSLTGVVSSGLIAALTIAREALLCKEEPKTGRKDRKSLAENKWVDLGLKTIGTNIGTVYGVSNIYQSVVSGFDIGDPITQSINQGVITMRDITRATDQFIQGDVYKRRNKRWGIKKGELKYKRTILKATNRAAGFLTMFAGLPYRNVINIGRHLLCLHKKLKEII
jgi:hypothetical protein